jgi:Schlafen, AlbA_2
MALLHIPLQQIDEARLNALIVAGAPETRYIDYKRQIYGNAHADYSEFLADISSFANTAGGDIVIGMDAQNGIPTTITPLTMPMDPEILRLEQVARGGLQPRLADIGFHAAAVPGGNVLIVRAPRSFTPPHRVVRQTSNRFWARSNAGKYEPDVNELRSLFLAGPRLAERVQDFRLDRIAKLVAGHGPIQLMERGTLVLHIVPLTAFDSPTVLALQPIERDFRIFVPMGSTTASGMRINFDGVLKTSNADPQATQHRAYTQLYRNGIVEAVASSLINDRTQVISYLDDVIVKETLKKLNDLASVGVEPPFAILVSLYGVRGIQLNFARGQNAAWFDDLGHALDRDQYHPQEVVLETLPQNVQECAKTLRPILDQIANAGGAAQSPIFDAQGNYIPPNRNQ